VVASPTEDAVLGRRLSAAIPGSVVYQRTFRPEADGWLADHRIFGRVVLPAAAMMAGFAAAARDALGHAVQLSDLSILRPLILPDEGTATWQFVVALDDGTARLSLHEAVGEYDWRLVATAIAMSGVGDVSIHDTALASTTRMSAEAWYARLRELGANFGPAFRVLDEMRLSDGAATAAVVTSRQTHQTPQAALTVLLDGALQLCSAAVPNAQCVHLPVAVERITIAANLPDRCRARAELRQASADRLISADVRVESEDGVLVALFEGVRLAAAESRAFDDAGAQDFLYELVWERANALSTARRSGESWLILADQAGMGKELAEALTAAGARCRVVAAVGDGHISSHGEADETGDRAELARVYQLEAWTGIVHLWSVDSGTLNDVDADDDYVDWLTCGSLLHLVQTLSQRPTRVYVVTRGALRVNGNENGATLQPRSAQAWGLANTIALEHPELRCRIIDLDPSSMSGGRLLEAELSAEPDVPAKVAFRSGERWVPQLAALKLPAPADEPIELQVDGSGTIEGLSTKVMHRRAPGRGEVRVRVAATGLNFRDVMLALRMYPDASTPLGAECAGEVVEVGTGVTDYRPGDRVMGFAPGSMASEVIVPAAFLARVPDKMSLDEAAAVPVAYLTAHYALHRVAQLRAGERVLIHAGTGGVGMAAIQLAQRAGAEVFATAGSPAKRAILSEMGVRHVLDSRSLEFAAEVRKTTQGTGVDIVLNSLTGEFIKAGFDVLAPGGRFVELGKRDLLSADAAARIRPDVRYCAFDLGAEALRDHGMLAPMYNDLLRALGQGTIRPLPVTLFDFEEAAGAFRYMAQARHVGKIVIRAPQISKGIRGDVTYWLTGGVGALGLMTAQWLAARGARYIVLTSRHAPGAKASEVITALTASGVSVHVWCADVGNCDELRHVLARIDAELPPLRGVIHAAGLLQDGVLVQQTWARARSVLSAKARGAWHLHNLLAERRLDFFVLYSAAGWLLGAAGQGVYAAANAALDALASARRALGLPALSVAWGRWEAGMAAQASDAWIERGVEAIGGAEAFDQLDRLLRSEVVAAVVAHVDWSRFLSRAPGGMDTQFFRRVSPKGTKTASEARAGSLATELGGLPMSRRRAVLGDHIVGRAKHLLGLGPDANVDAQRPLKDIGLDSLMAVELRNTLARSLGRNLPATLLFDYPTVDALLGHLLEALGLAQSNQQLDVAAIADENADIASLSDADAEALLLKELEAR
jgi:NADPH:quinone reductase-like Zn-dependent oxidoreductase/acyl carrier protein